MEVDMGYDFETAGFCNFNYAELYGVKPGESDFSGTIERSLKEGVKHLDDEKYIKILKDFLYGIRQR